MLIDISAKVEVKNFVCHSVQAQLKRLLINAIIV